MDWYTLENEHKKISFEYHGEIIIGIFDAFFDNEYETPEDNEPSFFSLKSSEVVSMGYNIHEVSNVKILDE